MKAVITEGKHAKNKASLPEEMPNATEVQQHFNTQTLTNTHPEQK